MQATSMGMYLMVYSSFSNVLIFYAHYSYQKISSEIEWALHAKEDYQWLKRDFNWPYKPLKFNNCLIKIVN